MALHLEIANKKSVNECLKDLVAGEKLDGANSYKCEQCDVKYPTLKRASLKNLPNVLIFVLHRFEFNYANMFILLFVVYILRSKKKINDYCEFPRDLNLREFTYDHLKKQEVEQADNLDIMLAEEVD